MNLTILGVGLIGAPMVLDLLKSKKFNIKAADISNSALNELKDFPIELCKTDLSIGTNVKEVIRDSNIVINAVPGSLGFETLRCILEMGKNVVDIAFYENDPFELDKIAMDNNATAIVDCGITPGLNNLLIGNVQRELDKIDKIEIYVGGLPELKEPPFEYKAVFSSTDVIEEYIRPARMIVDGIEVVKPALSDVEHINFPEVGVLEAFNSDGLRTLLKTVKAERMVEKTLRYPGHAEKIGLLRHMGLFNKEKVRVNESYIRPLDLTSKLLKPMWKLNQKDRDFTILRVNVSGRKKGNNFEYQFDLFDRYDEKTNTISMARTTGYTAASAVRMLAKGLYNKKGISPMEYVGKDPECVKFILGELENRGIKIKTNIKKVDTEFIA